MKYKHTWSVIDIETAPLPEAEIDQWLPDWVDWSPKMFDPHSVKTGNMKDPAKIIQKIDDERKKAEAEHFQIQTDKRKEIADKAALHPNTGWIFGIGVATPDGSYANLTLNQEDEAGIIQIAWDILTDTRTLVNHNLLGFDLPFLAARSMRLGIKIPFRISSVTPWSGQQLFLHSNPNPVTLLDTQQVAGKFAPTQRPSLNWTAKFFGLDSKVDLGGKLPWDVAREDFDKAMEYTRHDAGLTADVAMKMQLI